MDSLERWLAGLRGLRLNALLVVVALAAFLPGFLTLPPVDRDEARFAQTSRQMVASGDPVDLRFQEGTRYKKPVGIYWLQSAAVVATGGAEDAAIWRYRLPSLLAAVASVLLTAGLARRLGAPQAALPAGLLMATVFVLGAEARLAKTDAVVLMTVLLAMGPVITAFRDQTLGRWAAMVFWAALGVSALVKGPIGPMVVGLAVLVLCGLRRGTGWLGALRPWPGLILLLAIVLPWYLAITLKAGSAFWDEALGRDLVGKLQEGQEGHGAPPGSYLLALWVTFFPASVALALALPQLWASRRTQAFLICAAWLIPGWLVFELTPTKLLHYTLNFYPAIALAVALVWPAVVLAPRRWALVLAGLLALVPFATIAAVGAYAASLGPVPALPLALALVQAGAGTALAVVALQRALPGVTLLGLCLSGIAMQGALFPVAAQIPALWPAQQLADALPLSADCPDPVIHAQGFEEASLVFLSAGPVVWSDPEAAATALAQDPCAVALMPATSGFVAPQGVTEKAVIDGINLGNGRPVELRLFGR